MPRAYVTAKWWFELGPHDIPDRFHTDEELIEYIKQDLAETFDGETRDLQVDVVLIKGPEDRRRSNVVMSNFTEDADDGPTSEGTAFEGSQHPWDEGGHVFPVDHPLRPVEDAWQRRLIDGPGREVAKDVFRDVKMLEP